MGEELPGNGDTMVNSKTGNGDATSVNIGPDSTVDGVIGKAQEFNGTDERLDFDLNMGYPVYSTVELIAKGNSAMGWDALFGQSDMTVNQEVGVFLDSTGLNVAVFKIGSATPIASLTPIDIDEWNHYAFSINPAGVKTYCHNDKLTNTSATANLVLNTEEGRIGYDAYSTHYFPGTIDEVRISKTNRTDDWLAASYLSNTDNLITFSFLATGEGGIQDRHIPAFSNFPKPYNTNFLSDFVPSGLIRQNRKGFSKAF